RGALLDRPLLLLVFHALRFGTRLLLHWRRHGALLYRTLLLLLRHPLLDGTLLRLLHPLFRLALLQRPLLRHPLRHLRRLAHLPTLLGHALLWLRGTRYRRRISGTRILSPIGRSEGRWTRLFAPLRSAKLALRLGLLNGLPLALSSELASLRFRRRLTHGRR